MDPNSPVICIGEECHNGINAYTDKPCGLCHGTGWTTASMAQTYRHAMTYGHEPTWDELVEIERKKDREKLVTRPEDV